MTAKCYDCLDSVKALSLNFLTLLRSSVEFLHFWLFHLFRIGYIYPLLHLSNRQTVWFVSVLYRTTNSRFIFRISCSVHNEIHFSPTLFNKVNNPNPCGGSSQVKTWLVLLSSVDVFVGKSIVSLLFSFLYYIYNALEEWQQNVMIV